MSFREIEHFYSVIFYLKFKRIHLHVFMTLHAASRNKQTNMEISLCSLLVGVISQHSERRTWTKDEQVARKCY